MKQLPDFFSYSDLSWSFSFWSFVQSTVMRPRIAGVSTVYL